MKTGKKLSRKIVYSMGGLMLIGAAMLVACMVGMYRMSQCTDQAEVQSMAQTWIVVLIVFLALSVAAAIVLGGRAEKVISRSLDSLWNVTKELGKGNFGVQPEYSADDEVGQLNQMLARTAANIQSIISDISYNLHEMSKGNFQVHTQLGDDYYVGEFMEVRQQLGIIKQGISNTMNQITVAANQVASGANQVSAGAQALSQGSTQQASSAQKLEETVDQIFTKIGENAQSAKEANANAKDLGSCMSKSNQQMKDMIAAMTLISETSNKISTIVKTIQDIAFQTNILALNASVEAARAGAAGKGFAVVADEVRNLANKSQEASQNTAKLIEEASAAVERGTEIVNSTAQSLETAMQGAENMVTTINKITETSSQQAEAVQKVTQSVDNITNVIQTNSATSEEDAAASEELSGQAETLKSMVEGFKLRKSAEIYQNS